jgi:hypothetical protein
VATLAAPQARGLLLLGARVYHAELKRWLQPDTVDGRRYTYSGGDPVNFVDPGGRAPMRIPIAMAEMYWRLFYDWDGSGGEWNLMVGSAAHEARVSNTIDEIRERRRKSNELLDERSIQKLAGYRFASAIPKFTVEWPEVDRSEVEWGIGLLPGDEPRMINNVYSPLAGTVVGGGLGQGYGPFYLVLNTAPGIVVIGHLDPNTVHLSDGEYVVAGQYLGEYSETPEWPSDAPHVHIDLRPGRLMGVCRQTCGPIDWSAPGWHIPTGPGGRLTSGYLRNNGFTFHGGYDYVRP